MPAPTYRWLVTHSIQRRSDIPVNACLSQPFCLFIDRYMVIVACQRDGRSKASKSSTNDEDVQRRRTAGGAIYVIRGTLITRRGQKSQAIAGVRRALGDQQAWSVGILEIPKMYTLVTQVRANLELRMDIIDSTIRHAHTA